MQGCFDSHQEALDVVEEKSNMVRTVIELILAVKRSLDWKREDFSHFAFSVVREDSIFTLAHLYEADKEILILLGVKLF